MDVAGARLREIAARHNLIGSSASASPAIKEPSTFCRNEVDRLSPVDSASDESFWADEHRQVEAGKNLFSRDRGVGVSSQVITKILQGMLATLSAACLTTGCQSSKPEPNPKVLPETPMASTRNNCYSLLHQLLSEEKDVSLLRFIKHEQDDVKRLINRIAGRSKAGAEMLERFAKQDRSLNLKDIQLPSGETATRDAIAETKKHELLHDKGEEFELSLILSQTEALRYASHLAKVAAKNDSQPERSQALAHLSGEMEGLYQELTSLLSVRESAHANAKSRVRSLEK